MADQSDWSDLSDFQHVVGWIPALLRLKTAGCGSGPAIRSCGVEKVFAVFNQMEADGVIGRYAIGGAVGAIFWLEPILTKDVDVLRTHLEA